MLLARSLTSSIELSGAAPASAQSAPGNFYDLLRNNWFSLVALAFVVLPTLVNLSRETWSTEAGAHGPIVLATGLWLLHYSMPELLERRSAPPPIWLMILCTIPVVLVYIAGRALDLLVLEVAGAIAMGFLLIIHRCGFAVIWARPFPFIYLSMLIPIPGWILDYATLWLQHIISNGAASMLALLDYPVMREGVVIYVAQYQLLVEDACSGMNSLFGLIAISLFYIYLLHRADWRHALLLIITILPIAIFVNFLRVLLLILITYHFGDAVAQGFIHNFAGIVLFALSLSLMVLVDFGIRWTMRRTGGVAA